MTVSAQTPINRSTGNGVTTVFPYTFKIVAAADIEVTVDGTVKTLNVDYTVSGVGVDGGGNVTMTTAPASGTSVVRRRNMSLVRNTDYQDQGELPAATLDSDIDATVLMIQQLDEEIGRALTLSPGVSGVSATLPTPTASNFVGWDALGTGLQNYTGVASVPVSTFMAAVVAAVSAAAARSALGAAASGPNNDITSLLALTKVPSVVSQYANTPGVLFDSSAGDTFTKRLSYPSNAALTVTPSKAAFSAAVDTVSDLKVKDPYGNLLQFCFDNFTIEATYTVTSFPAADADGFYTAFLAATTNFFGGQIKAHPGSATQFFARELTNNAITANDVGGVAFVAGDKVVTQLVFNGDTLTLNFTYGANPLRTTSVTMVYAATSFELPRMFMTPIVRMKRGVFSLDSLKVYASYPHARFAFVGDSLTQGRTAGSFSAGFAQLMRAQFPNGTLICGAPAATVGDWLVPAYSVTAMFPTYGFVLLGTNDVTTAVPLATTQANYLSLLTKFTDAGITPIIMTIPPNGNNNTPAYNTWLKTLGYSYIDLYPLLLGTGVAMNAAYDSGDGIHPNSAGHTVIYNAIISFITSNSI